MAQVVISSRKAREDYVQSLSIDDARDTHTVTGSVLFLDSASRTPSARATGGPFPALCGGRSSRRLNSTLIYQQSLTIPTTPLARLEPLTSED